MPSYLMEGSSLGATFDAFFSRDRSITPSVGPALTFSRASTAYELGSSGVYTSKAINVPRFSYYYNGNNWISRGLFAEGQRTNDLTYSRDFTNAAWVKIHASDTISAGVADSPMGTLGASKIIASTTNTFHGISRGTVSFTGQRACSVFFKAAEYSFVGIEIKDNFRCVIDLTTGAVMSNTLAASSIVIRNFGNGWWRISYHYSSTVDRFVVYPLPTATFGSFAGTGSAGVLIDQAQIETGPLASSPIVTTNAAATRSADVCSLTLSSDIWSATQNYLVVHGDTPASGTNGLLGFDDTTSSERAEIYTSGTDPKFIVVDGGVTQADIDGGTTSARQMIGVGARFKANDCAITVDGGSLVTDASVTLPTVTRMLIGCNQAGNYTEGHIGRVMILPSATDAVLQRLATV